MNLQSQDVLLFEQIMSAETNDFLELANVAGLDVRHDFSGADLSGIDLANADLSGCDFSYADLSNANLRNANFTRADLRNASFINADLTGANLSKSELSEADFSGAKVQDVKFSNSETRSARNLDARIKRQKTREELEKELAQLRRSQRTSTVVESILILFRYSIVVMCVYLASTLINLSSDAKNLFDQLLGMSPTNAVLSLFGLGGLLYGFAERRQRQRMTERQRIRMEKLERSIDQRSRKFKLEKSVDSKSSTNKNKRQTDEIN